MESLTTVLREFEGCRFFVRGETFDVAAKDVVIKALGQTWDGHRLDHVPPEWKGRASDTTPGGVQEITTLSEQGLYFLLARSDSPRALPFQKKVAELVTTLRQTGKVELRPQSFEEKALEVFMVFQAKIADQAKQLAEAAPKIAFADHFEVAAGNLCLRDAAKQLGHHPKAWSGDLCSAGYLYRGTDGVLRPYSKWIDSGYFQYTSRVVDGHIRQQTLVTPAGMTYFAERDRRLACAERPTLVIEARP